MEADLSFLRAWHEHERCLARMVARLFQGKLPLRAAYDIAWFWLAEPSDDLADHHVPIPSSSGRSDASSWYTTVEVIDHDEPAAVVDPDVARSAAEPEWADAVANQIACGADLPSQQELMAVEEKLLLLSFRRNPAELRKSLLECPELQACRDDLNKNSLDYILPSGGMIFVSASQHKAAMTIIAARGIKSHDIVVSESLEYHVEAALMSIPGRFRPSRGTSTLGPLPSPWVFAEERTFLAFIPRQRAASSVVQSTGEVHGAPNPRRSVNVAHILDQD